MKTVYVFGNEYLEEDKAAVTVAQMLNDVKIVHCRTPDDLLDAEDKEITILDTVKGIDKPTLITDIKQLKTKNIISLHDFDVGYFLNMMNELGMAKKIKIIGIPANSEHAEMAKEVEKWL